MILTNRLFTRRAPFKNAKSLYIFCEGRKREYQYFNYFKGIDSNINIEVYALRPDENNTPTGLYEIARTCLIRSIENPNPKYEFLPEDEVWFVIDTDQWNDKIDILRKKLQNHEGWKVAQSNPCFEVWLYFHQLSRPSIPHFFKDCTPWRSLVAQHFPGGFDARRHPILIGSAIEHAQSFYQEIGENYPSIGCTQTFLLGKVIFEACQEKIMEALAFASIKEV
jgi:hypothetical protein